MHHSAIGQTRDMIIQMHYISRILTSQRGCRYLGRMSNPGEVQKIPIRLFRRVDTRTCKIHLTTCVCSTNSSLVSASNRLLLCAFFSFPPWPCEPPTSYAWDCPSTELFSADGVIYDICQVHISKMLRKHVPGYSGHLCIDSPSLLEFIAILCRDPLPGRDNTEFLWRFGFPDLYIWPW